ncbi:efflux RND transporter periplasmic adaptor subunit [Ottowia sp.]|uniref:efflux RND transporter periplasmic adaptor subunit n=1 Tax=Ottowia sp. TaxID=1898956 RepID=UPI002C034F34|nr:efflux RND transporter periplasmic adaptor subunit [Ottowia sp.]HPZ58748.1 efflux RND transporter periplasmic adaptor subunit [Ottowia sp.]HQD47827.1 efflux RND transporter periplasmic adaptor subunit [Ottowia sp.]
MQQSLSYVRAGGLVLAALLLAACGKAPPPEEPVRAVKLVTVGEGRYESGHEYAGEVRARVESRLGFRVAGKIVRRAVEAGQRVQAGQLLAQLDARDYQLAADAARAQVSSATTQRDLAAADLRRYQSLRDQGFISGAEIERRSATLKAAQATLDQARAQLSSQGNQAGYTQLLADAGGVVTGVDAEVGQVVAAGTPVVRIAQDGPRDVVFAVPEDRVAAIRVGQAVGVRAWASDAQWSGSVREVAASADPVTRTYAVKVALAGAAPPLGATVTVEPQHSGAQGQPVIKLPTSALWQQGQGSAVWVYEAASGTVRAQAVQVAGADGNEVVIAAGLTPGMRVVATGAHVLAPGQKVTVYQPTTAPARAPGAPSAIHNAASAPTAAAAAASR